MRNYEADLRIYLKSEADLRDSPKAGVTEREDSPSQEADDARLSPEQALWPEQELCDRREEKSGQRELRT